MPCLFSEPKGQCGWNGMNEREEREVTGGQITYSPVDHWLLLSVKWKVLEGLAREEIRDLHTVTVFLNPGHKFESSGVL